MNSQSKRTKLKNFFYSLVPLIALFLLAEAISSIVFYQLKGKSAFAIFSVVKLVGKKIRGEKTEPGTAPRFIRLPEHKKLADYEMMPIDTFLANCDNLPMKKYKIRTDENAFLLPSVVHKDPDLVLAFFGGSTTECLFNEEEARFPYKVGQLMEKRLGLKVNSYNNGISSITSMNSFNILVNKVIPLHPDYALLMHNINDMNILMYEGTYWNDHPFRSLIVDPENPRFSEKKYGIDEWADSRGKHINLDTAYILDNFKHSLLSFIAICKIWQIEPVLMTEAGRFTDEPSLKILGNGIKEWKKNGLEYSQIKTLFDKMNDCIRQVAFQNNILLIDLARTVPQTSEYFYDVVHYTDKGSLFVAEKIADILTSLKMSKANNASIHKNDSLYSHFYLN